ncbi:MAG: aminopeptidase [Candidatus Zixiibacteriota bacterium]|nr:MAG: aminopeptidase [candidate division Zixibacteria bacterium]
MRQSTVILAATAVFFVVTCVTAADKGAVDDPMLERFERRVNGEDGHRQIINAITNNDIKDLSLNRERLVTHDKLFSLKLETTGVTNQKSSGRCWIFAGANVLTPKIKQKLDQSDFELSHSYLAFWDKLEKANFFLERVIEMRDRPLDDRSLTLEFDYLFGDGGWWHYFTDLIDKYGLVPVSAMPETKQSSATGSFNGLAKHLLRRVASDIRERHRQGKNLEELRVIKANALEDIYRLLVYNYGQPPKEFTFRYEKDVDSTEQIIAKTYTPRSFFEECLAEDWPEYVTIVNNPSMDFDQLYELEASRNIYERPDFRVLNLPVEELKEYTLLSLMDSQAVWFSCDVGRENYGDSGVMAVGIYDFNGTFDMDFNLNKADRIRFKDISPNHAMVINGVDTSAAGAPVKWRVENSWGTKRGDNGIWYMYDDWFTEYVLTVVIDKRLLSDEDRQKLKQKPDKIADWEPFFLALRNLD